MSISDICTYLAGHYCNHIYRTFNLLLHKFEQMLLSLSILGIVSSVILIYFNSRRHSSSIYLGLFFLLISLYSLISYVVLYSRSPVLVGIFFLNAGFLTYMAGPMLYWYVRSVLTDNSRLKKSDYWHFLPMGIFFIATLPHLFLPWSGKMELATKIVEDANNVWIFNRNLFYGLIPPYFIFISRPLLVLGYTIVSFTLYIRYLKRPDRSRTFSRQTFMTKWLAVLFIFLFVLLISYLGLITEVKKDQNVFLFYTFNLLLELSGIGLFGLLVSPFFFPGVLYGIPRIHPGALPEKFIMEEKQRPVSENRKQAPDFERDYLMTIQQKTEASMALLKPYLQSDCNLYSLAKSIMVPAHHLSYFFREVKKQSFNDYRNEWRIKHAKKLISEGKSMQMTLEAIGLSSGFSSRNAFVTAFKKVEGTSPGAFASQFMK